MAGDGEPPSERAEPRVVAVIAAALLVVCTGLVACTGPEKTRGGPSGSMEEFRELLEAGEVGQIEWEDSGPGLGPDDDLFDDGMVPDLLLPNPDVSTGAGVPPLLQQGVVTTGESVASTGSGRATSPFSSNPYLLFGPRIVVHPDERITKVYPLPPGKGTKMLELMRVLRPFPVAAFDSPGLVPPEYEPDPAIVEVVLLEQWDQEAYQNMDEHPPPPPNQVNIADWMVVTANENLLWEVESFVKVFAAGVPQIEIEAKIVEVTESDELDIGIRSVRTSVGEDTVSTPIFSTLGEDDFDVNGNPLGDTLVDDFSFDFPNKIDVAESLLSLSTIQSSYTVSAILEAVKNWENVSINSQPKIAVREGGTASIVNTTDIPFYGFGGITDSGNFQATLQIKEVGTKLFVVPRVVADTVAMDINLEVSQQVGTLVSFFTQDQGELVAPIIAKRQARTVVYLEPGQAVVLGGLTSERKVQEQSKVPLLGDIPLLGFFFRSTFTRKETTHVLFIIRPRVLQAAELRNEL